MLYRRLMAFQIIKVRLQPCSRPPIALLAGALLSIEKHQLFIIKQ